MIGNDIIDLQLAKKQSSWQRPGFLEKQFTKKEIQAIRNSRNSFESVWRFWSMKEAAYKAIVQQLQKRFFAPHKFECEIVSHKEGKVTFEKSVFKIRTEIHSQYIYSVTGNSSFQWLNSQSDVSFIQEVERKTGFSATHLQIQKNDVGIPNLFYANQQVSNSLSKTHHGRFKAIEYH